MGHLVFISSAQPDNSDINPASFHALKSLRFNLDVGLQIFSVQVHPMPLMLKYLRNGTISKALGLSWHASFMKSKLGWDTYYAQDKHTHTLLPAQQQPMQRDVISSSSHLNLLMGMVQNGSGTPCLPTNPSGFLPASFLPGLCRKRLSEKKTFLCCTPSIGVWLGQFLSLTNSIAHKHKASKQTAVTTQWRSKGFAPNTTHFLQLVKWTIFKSDL